MGSRRRKWQGERHQSRGAGPIGPAESPAADAVGRGGQAALPGDQRGRLGGPGMEDIVNQDNGLRADTSLEALARLKPVFDRRYGSVHA